MIPKEIWVTKNMVEDAANIFGTHIKCHPNNLERLLEGMKGIMPDATFAIKDENGNPTETTTKTTEKKTDSIGTKGA